MDATISRETAGSIGSTILLLGSAISFALAAVAIVPTVGWLSDHPPIPYELRYEVVTPPPGGNWAYRWMGALHVQDRDGFRLATPIRTRPTGGSRIVIVGDSYAYGEGVQYQSVFSSRLEAYLREHGIARAEVVNLARPASQAEDILKLVRERVSLCRRTRLSMLSHSAIISLRVKTGTTGHYVIYARGPIMSSSSGSHSGR